MSDIELAQDEEVISNLVLVLSKVKWRKDTTGIYEVYLICKSRLTWVVKPCQGKSQNSQMKK